MSITEMNETICRPHVKIVDNTKKGRLTFNGQAAPFYD